MSIADCKIFILLAATATLTATTAAAQNPQPNSPDNPQKRVEDRLQSGDEFDELHDLPDITKWLPIEKFAEEMRATESQKYQPRTFTTTMVIPKKQPRFVVVSPDNNTVKFGKNFSISNGNAGNWGVPYPSAFLDARTLSFPVPRH